jgi:hypothetical protein
MKIPLRQQAFFRFIASTTFLASLLSPGGQSTASPASSADPAGRTALQYVEAMAAGRVTAWAGLDLGCLTKGQASASTKSSDEACWKATLAAHTDLLADQSEEGIFGAQGRGLGFGLLDDSHRKADLWRDYPPAVFLSPAAWQRGSAPMPRIKFLKTLPVRVTGLQISESRPPVRVSVTLVELAVTYPNPLLAPLALLPGEPWWASGQIRRYGPVRDLIVRVPVVSGLKAAGYPVDHAVLSAALPETPMLLGTGGGGISEIGRTSDRPGEHVGGQELVGGLLLGSVRWWDRASASNQFAAELRDVRGLAPSPDRQTRMRRLLRLDSDDLELNRLLGQDSYRRLLNAGLAKGAIDGGDEDMRRRLAELYWTIQAPTWRQDLTDVAVGHSESAEALYRAARSLGIVVRNGDADLETVRRLGALHRWNNDSEAALRIHEGALSRLLPAQSRARGAFLAEAAWDRLQWIFWTRRYEHPWLAQAKQEAEQASALAEAPMDKLVAAEAMLVAEALSVPRQPARVQASLELVREWHGKLQKVSGLWPHLIANDMVKAFIPESATMTLPSTARSSEVLDVRIHATPPPQDLLRTWEFDKDQAGAAPQGFSAVATPAAGGAGWIVQPDAEAPTSPHVLAHKAGCATSDCFHVLLAEATGFAFPDVTVHLRIAPGATDGGAGIVMAASDRRVSYAVTLNEATETVAIYRLAEGQTTLLDRTSVQLRKRPWHLLRVQRNNFAHVSKPRLSVFVDNREVYAVTDDAIPTLDRIGLVTRGTVQAQFDRLQALNLVSNQPLSSPAAY